MPSGRVNVLESVSAELVPYAPPRFPCPKCERETKAHQEPGTRICSNKDCRHVHVDPDLMQTEYRRLVDELHLLARERDKFAQRAEALQRSCGTLQVRVSELEREVRERRLR